MQLIAIPRFRISSSVFNPSLSAVLSGMTAVGAISTAIYHFESTKSKIGTSLTSLLDTEATKYLLSGFSKLGDTFQKWGSLVVGSKDAFVDWFKSYFGADGLKAGVSALYERLKAWTLIVYDWFATKFIEFLGNIPRMVKEWDKLRLSLFKWGTFLGGGGGAALWAMFGSGANLGELGELMSNPKFGEMMEKFGTLFNDNKEAFDELGAEGIKAILEEYLKDPDKADKAADELMKDQEAKKEKAEKEAKEQEKEMPEKAAQLTAEEIMEKYKPSAGGSPPDRTAMVGTMVKGGLQAMLKSRYSFASFDVIKEKAKKSIQEYLDKIKADAENPLDKSKVKKEFWEIIKDKVETFVNGLADAAEKAYRKFEEQKPEKPDIERLTEAFINSITIKAPDNSEGDAGKLVEALSEAKK